MSLTKQIIKNTSYLALGKIASTILGLIALALLLRYLSPDDYGRYTTVLAFILLFGTFVDFGLNLTVTQDISLPGQDVSKTLSAIFTLRALVNIALVALLPLILLLFPYDRQIKQAVYLTAILFFTQSLFQVLASYFQMSLKAGKIALAELVGKAVMLGATVVAIKLNFSFVPLMATVALSGLAQLWALLRPLQKGIKLEFLIDLGIWRRIISKTWPVALSVVFTTLYFKGDTIILSLFRPLAEVGIYGAAYKILEVLISLPILFMGLILPKISAAVAQGQTERFQKLVQKSWDGLSLVTLPMAAGTIALAGPIINLIAGPGYEDSARVLQIIILAAGIIFLGAIFTHAIVAVNKQKAMLKFYGLAALLSLILYFIYIPRYSYFAAAAITVLAELIIALAAFWQVRSSISFKLSHVVFAKAALASVIMAIILTWLSDLPVLAAIAAGALIYLLLAAALRALPLELLKTERKI